MQPENESSDASARSGQTTRWTTILRARAGGAGDAECEEAWKVLVERYRGPILAQVRKRFRNHDPDDLVDEFISLRLCRQILPEADRTRGGFRDLLATVLRRFIADKLRKMYAEKRGGGVADIPLDGVEAERNPALVANPEDFGRGLDRDFAQGLLRQAVEEMRQAFLAHRAKRLVPAKIRPEEEFELLIGKEAHLPIAKIAERIGKSEGAVKTDRCRWQETLRNRVRQAVSDLVRPEEVEQEMKYLLSLAAQGGE